MSAERIMLPRDLPATPPTTFMAKLAKRWSQGHFVCVGLDADFSQIPQALKDAGPATAHRQGYQAETVLRFNQQIIDATADLVCAYKPNIAFYEAHGDQGLRALADTIRYIKDYYPAIPVLLDAKRADIGNTNNGYVQAAFDTLDADAVTIHPYLGKEAMKPFLDRADRGIFVLARTSNPGASEFQNLKVGEAQEPLYRVIAREVARSWNSNGNCALVVGATYPRELAEIRAVVGDIPILLPGIGAQGGELEATVKAGLDSRNTGIIVSSSRGVIFASNGPDFAQAARAATQKLSDEINLYR